MSELPRRGFIQNAGLAAAGILLANPLLGAEKDKANRPGEGIKVAGIGVGGQGGHNIRACAAAGAQIVALCDVHPGNCKALYKAFPSAPTYTDFRVMLEKHPEIQAVIIATPDHTHAHIAMACMRAGKHVYVQKPLAHDVFEARRMTEAAREHKVVSQMGNQGRSGEGIRLIQEWVAAGLIGEVREAHAWTNRPIWPSDSEMDRPAESPPVPEGMDWNLWVGPAPMRPYHPAYHPGKWRAWADFGTGALGDMGCHIIDAIFVALRLRYPESVEATVPTSYTAFGKEAKVLAESFPRASIVRYRFPARDALPPVEMTWWDGGLMPPRPAELDDDMPFGDWGGGCLFVGTKGKITCGCYAEKPRLLSAELRAAAKALPKTVPRIPGGVGGHEADWLRAIKGGAPACSNFDVSGPLSEAVLMGNLAVRFPNRKLLWDGAAMKVTNNEEANKLVRRVYREGFAL